MSENIDKYRAINKTASKERYAKNKKESLSQNKAWREKNRERRAEYMKKWMHENREHLNAYRREYRKTPIAKVLNHVYGSLRRCVDGNGESAAAKLGYTTKQLQLHIERQFTGGMTWENYGSWEIDHIIPIRQFFQDGVTDVAKINALSNLRPLCKTANRKKSGMRTHLL